MHWYSVFAIYVLFWWMSVFLVLPWGVRTHREAGVERVPGQADSAPHDFSVWRVVGRITVVATILFGIFAANYVYGWVTPDMLDLWGNV